MIAKVCGLTAAEDIRMVLKAGADFIGFLYHPASPRHCPDLDLALLAGDRAVLVASASSTEDLMALALRTRAPWVQPHVPRDLATATVQSLKKAGFKVLMPWPDEEPPSAAETPDLFLWESSPKSTGLPGGSGRTHPMLFPPPAPFLLAGGLDGCNVKERWAAMPPDARRNCLGFDAASRLEETPGRKSPHKVTAFVQESHSLR